MSYDKNRGPTPQERELMRIAPAVEMGLKLALDKLNAGLQELAEVLHDVTERGKLVDVYVKLKDGRTAVGTAIVPELEVLH